MIKEKDLKPGQILTYSFQENIAYDLQTFMIFFLIIGLFRPSIGEFLLTWAVDLVFIAIFMRLLEKKIFHKIYPEYKLYFPYIDIKSFEFLNEEQKFNLVKNAYRYPLKRSLFLFFLNLIKNSPIGLIVVFLWEDHLGIGYTGRAIYFMSAELLLSAFLLSETNLKAHKITSEAIKTLSTKLKLSNSIYSLDVRPSKIDSFIQEYLNILILPISLFLFNTSYFLASQNFSKYGLISLCTVGLIIISRNIYSNKKHFLDSLGHVKDSLNSLNLYEQSSYIPLNTNSVVRNFECSYNALIERLQVKETEITNLIQYQTENSNVKSLGEIAGLVVHDMATPVHSLKFCMNELKEDEGLIDDQLLDVMQNSIDRTHSLVDSLRSHLKDIEGDASGVDFQSCHDNIIKILSVEFYSKGFDKVKILLEKNGFSQIKISRFALNHILYNLYKNSIQNLLENEVVSPILSIKLHQTINNEILISVLDNGTGLEREAFERMTNNKYIDYNEVRKSLGLKLTRRLIEGLGGSLSLVDNLIIGTQFNIYLPQSDNKEGAGAYVN